MAFRNAVLYPFRLWRCQVMACKPVCQLCPRLVISTAINFDGTNVIVGLPAGSYENGCKYCVVIAQTIPTSATINAPVVFSIGDGTERYPLTTSCCTQVTACGIRTRTRYSLIVSTNATGGTFKMIGKPCCMPNNSLTSIDGTAPAA